MENQIYFFTAALIGGFIGLILVTSILPLMHIACAIFKFLISCLVDFVVFIFKKLF